jgi:hypothetical protein
VSHQIRRPLPGRTLGVGLGLEVTIQGNADFQTTQAGAVTDLMIIKHSMSNQGRAGYARHGVGGSATPNHAYFGIGFYRRF